MQIILLNNTSQTGIKCSKCT